MMHKHLAIGVFIVSILAGCQSETDLANSSNPDAPDAPELRIPFEKFTLANGLEVVLHEDRSDPIVAVALLYHVGSAREKPGRTGFAHLFEHLLFQSSENLGEGAFMKGIPALGGTFNGGTNSDSTIYFEVVPNDALERVLWMESDRLGFFINTVTQPRMENEKQVVKNEKRQRVDNRPYGHTSSVISSNLYPPDHPYNWQVIGSLRHLEAATLADVRDFYARFYGPQNVTLVISGDFDRSNIKALVERYFGEITTGGDVPAITAPIVTLAQTKHLYHEDNFAQLPALTLAWPTVPNFHPDSYALDTLAQLLAEGKNSPFHKVVVEGQELAPNVSAFQSSREIAGEFRISARAFAATDLDSVKAAFDEAFARFEADGINEADLDRTKASLETDFYNGISSALGKAFQLAQYNTFAGDPGFISQDLAALLDVSVADVMDVYQRYLKAKPYIATSFVPQGQLGLALEKSTKANVLVEEIVADAEVETSDLSAENEYTKTPSSIDRSQKPSLGSMPVSFTPNIWAADLDNGMSVLGITDAELPLVRFTIRLRGGMLLDSPDKVGVANLTANMLLEGTASRTPEELEEAIQQLGATLNVTASREWVTVSGNTLLRNFPATMDLVNEVLLEPRWDENRFAQVKQRTLAIIQQENANPNAITASVFNKLLYGPDNILAHRLIGNENSVALISLDDLKQYYATQFSPSVATMHVVGDISTDDVVASLSELNERWQAKPVAIPQPQFKSPTKSAKVYFVDVPDAPQSVIRVGYMAMPLTDPDYYPATVMNYQLGGGSTGRLFQNLRVQKGYTYGAYSRLTGTSMPGPFAVSTSVRANVTYESASLIKEILTGYQTNFSAQDLDTTQNALIRGNLVKLETLSAKLAMLQDISGYELPDDYVRQREAIVADMTVAGVQKLAAQFANPDTMTYLIVGDAATQLEQLEALGYGEPIQLDRDGNPIGRSTNANP